MSAVHWGDDEATTTACPGCWRPLDTTDLCDHDDDTGPMCRDRCCGFWHGEAA